MNLSHENLSSFQNQILWNELPQTFQDAIEATRQL